METICFTATARIRRPQSNLIYFDDYRCHLETDEVTQKRPSDLRQLTKRATIRRHLELLCLLLEAFACASLFLLTMMATVRFFVS